MTTMAPQHVQRLVVERFKRVTDVEIAPDTETPTVLITGRNAQGKSSVLDALETVLTGVDKRRTPKPIHEGEKTARIVAETEDLVITRTFKETAKGTDSTLTIAAKDGAKYSSPQKMLDELYGQVSVDPWAFATMPAKEQRAVLMALVDLPFDLDAMDTKRAGLYSERTDANRKVKDLQAQWSALPQTNEDVPEVEHSVSDLLGRIQAANEHDRAVREAGDRAAEYEEEVAHLERTLARVKTLRDEAVSEVRRLSEVEAEDVQELTGILTRFEDSNREIRENQRVARERADVGRRLASAREDADLLDRQISRIDADKAKGLAQAEFPVPGLAFTEDGILYQGQPFEQASTAEKIRVSFAVATSRPGSIRVVLIRNAESLDRSNLDLIAQLAAEKDMQVWMERVAEVRALDVFHLEDGRLAE